MRIVGVIVLCCLLLLYAGAVRALSIYANPKQPNDVSYARSSEGIMLVNDSETEKSNKDCIARLSAFVSDLDALLMSSPASTGPVRSLVYKYFPLENCDIEKAIDVVKRSRFFSFLTNEQAYVAIVFSSKGFAGPTDNGYFVQFSLVKDSGNSRLPFVSINPTAR